MSSQFKKLLANLPFNPSLLDQVSFYAHRLRRESEVRRLGFIFMVLAMAVQVTTAMYPAQKSLASSPNDILSGISSKSDILQAWDNNTANVRGIYGHWGVTRENIANIPGEAPNVTVNSAIEQYNFWSIGRLPLSAFGIDSAQWGERAVNAGGTTVYQRPLKATDTNPSGNKYPAYYGKNSLGVSFWILQDSGSLVTHGAYLPHAPKARLAVHKTLLTSTTAKPGDTVKFQLAYRNVQPDSLATNFKLVDALDNNLDFVSLDDLAYRSGNVLTITRSGYLGYTPNHYISTLVAKVKSNVPAGTAICNQAAISSSEFSGKSPERPCLTVVHSNPPPNTLYCIATTSFLPGSNRDFTVKTAVYNFGAGKIGEYQYDIDANGTIDFTDKTSETPHSRVITGLGNGQHQIRVKVPIISPAGPVYHTATCDTQINIAEDPRAILTKSVSNQTKNQADASDQLVKSGDILKFKLTTENVTGTDYKNYAGLDYFGSVLQYADITDPNELKTQGITLGNDQQLRWTTFNLKARSKEVKTITVMVKPVVPSTNRPSGVSPDYNCKISNSYGNQVIMSVDCPLVKVIAEGATTNLPNTGPGTTIIVGAAVTVLAGYLFARSRVMAKELAIVRQNYISAGGI